MWSLLDSDPKDSRKAIPRQMTPNLSANIPPRQTNNISIPLKCFLIVNFQGKSWSREEKRKRLKQVMPVVCWTRLKRKKQSRAMKNLKQIWSVSIMINLQSRLKTTRVSLLSTLTYLEWRTMKLTIFRGRKTSFSKNGLKLMNTRKRRKSRNN